MDIVINKDKEKKLSNTKKYIISVAIAVPVLLLLNYLWFLGRADFSVDRDTLTFGEVKRGNFVVSVRGTGVLAPNNIQWLSTNVDAKVERVVLKAGKVVKTGDLIVVLNNPQLVQELSEAKWEYEAMEQELKAARVAQETALVEQKTNALNAKMNYDRGVNEFNARSELIKTAAVSKLDYQRSRVDMEQFKQSWDSAQEQLAKMQENLAVQNKARAARLNKSKKSVERLQQQVDDLQVKATMDSIVLEMPLEAGQRITTGSNIAKLAQQDSLIAELKVPEIQIRDVAIGQPVVIDTRNSKIEGIVSRVDPAVMNGNVQVDVAFSKKLPDDARPDLSVDGVIKITEIPDTLYVDRPLFAQSKSNTALYKVNKDGKLAERVEVGVGYGSVNQIQVLKGLQIGDKIVTSDPTRFQTHDKFRIK